MALPRLLITLLVLSTLAGCSGGGGKGVDDPLVDDDEFKDVKATEDTGVIRGVVVDEAVRPLAGVVVSIVQLGLNATSADSGAFSFTRLQPGTYFLTAAKVGYKPVQQGVEVLAGVSEPELTKILLPTDPEQRPFHELYSWEGYVQCSARFFVNAIAGACPEDNTTYRINVDVVPTFAQSEMLYESTQAAGNGLRLEYTDDSDGGLDNYVIDDGPSPLLITANETLMEEKHVGDGETGLYIRIFAGTVPETQPPTCIPTTACYGGSVIINQGFKVYTVLFYNYLPPEGWLFSVDGEPKPPGT